MRPQKICFDNLPSEDGYRQADAGSFKDCTVIEFKHPGQGRRLQQAFTETPVLYSTWQRQTKFIQPGNLDNCYYIIIISQVIQCPQDETRDFISVHFSSEPECHKIKLW